LALLNTSLALSSENLARQSRNQKGKMDIITKRTKSTKEERLVICQIHFPYPAFVSFAIFVVKKSFVESRISDNRPPEKFAQAAKT
jgi:hypothetical protein